MIQLDASHSVQRVRLIIETSKLSYAKCRKPCNDNNIFDDQERFDLAIRRELAGSNVEND